MSCDQTLIVSGWSVVSLPSSVEIMTDDGHKTITRYIVERVVTSNMVPKQHARSAASAKRNDGLAVVTINPEIKQICCS